MPLGAMTDKRDFSFLFSFLLALPSAGRCGGVALLCLLICLFALFFSFLFSFLQFQERSFFQFPLLSFFNFKRFFLRPSSCFSCLCWQVCRGGITASAYFGVVSLHSWLFILFSLAHQVIISTFIINHISIILV